jgi:putative tryptophan/tyrosine transport system substrate-binding protein
MRRRAFITLLGGAAAGWPLMARAQQPAMPVIAFLNGGEAEQAAANVTAFRKGLSEAGLVEGRNVSVEFHWFEGRYDQMPAVVADLVRRKVAVIASPGFPPGALTAKAATTAIPVVFGVGDDPVKLGLVASIARPGGNVTGINFFVHELISKRLGFLRELVPGARRIAVMVNSNNADAAVATLREARTVAPSLGMDILEFDVRNSAEIDAGFAAIAREKADGLLVGGDGLLNSRRGQFATLAARDKVPTIAFSREFVQAGLLMSYGTSLTDMFRQVGIYAGSIAKGARPADLPVLQSTKFEFVINLQTAKALGLEVPPAILALADAVIE